MLEKTNATVRETMATVETSNNSRRRRRWLAAGILLLAAALVAVFTIGRSQVNTISYQTWPVQSGNLEISVTATGNLEATNQVDVGSELSGIVTSVKVDFNDRVERDQPLAYLDDTKYRAAVLKSRAEVASATAQYQEAVATQAVSEKTLGRYKKTLELTSGKLPSQENMERAQADLERSIAAVTAAKAAIDMAKASLASNRSDLEKAVILSPINGIVLSRDVEEGQTVAASLQAPVLFTLAEDLRHMELQVDVDEADVGQIREGQRARFSVDAYPDRTFEAQITQVRFGAETTDGVVTYKTVLSVENPDLLLRPGMTATASVIVRNIENALLVPNSALRYNPAGKEKAIKEKRGFLQSLLPGPRRRIGKANASTSAPIADNGAAKIWVLKEHDQAVAVRVEKVATDGVMTAVTSTGLNEGEAVITNEIMSGT